MYAEYGEWCAYALLYSIRCQIRNTTLGTQYFRYYYIIYLDFECSFWLRFSMVFGMGRMLIKSKCFSSICLKMCTTAKVETMELSRKRSLIVIILYPSFWENFTSAAHLMQHSVVSRRHTFWFILFHLLWKKNVPKYAFDSKFYAINANINCTMFFLDEIAIEIHCT